MTATEIPAQLQLQSIRHTLIRQEDTIIFALIERAQFKQNDVVYEPGASQFRQATGESSSFLEFMLLDTERIHSRVRRYTAPDEYAFFPDRLPPPALPLLDFPRLLHESRVNLNARIMDIYRHKVRPAVCEPGDDTQYGSSVVADVNVLQAISKRVHYGMFVAESKFIAQEEEYRALIAAMDEDAIMALLTDSAVEERVLRRVRRKAETFGQDIDDATTTENSCGASPPPKGKVDPEAIVQMYRDFIIPLTKEAEVIYLLQRLAPCRLAYHGAAGCTCHSLVRRHVGADSDLVPCASVQSLFEALLSNRATYGLVLLEQSGHGLLPEAVHALRNTPLLVLAELREEMGHLLLSHSPLTSVRRVVGTAAALSVCSAWLRQTLPGSYEQAPLHLPFEVTEAATNSTDDGSGTAFLVDSPTEAARQLADRGAFVVTSTVDDPSATMRARALIIGKRSGFGDPTGHDKTIVVFEIPDETGRLADALALFHRNGVNLGFIQSSGGPTATGRFYVELSGHVHDSSVSTALGELLELATFVKVLGSFNASDNHGKTLLGYN